MERNRLKVALLGPLPPPAGGIASWTRRMLDSPIVAESVDMVHVDETVSRDREIFGTTAKRSLLREIARCRRIWRDLDHALKQGGIEAVHANIPAATLSMTREIVCALIARRRNVPFIIHFRCTVPVMVSGVLGRIVLKALLRLSAASIVLNVPSEEYVRRISKVETYLIPNFVSEAEVSFGKSRGGFTGPIKRVLYTGGIIESKGALDILEVARCMPGVEFRLAGKGELPAGYELPRNAVLLGQLDRGAVLKEYERADAFLFLSRFEGEGFSNSLAEAMAMGLPCVVSDWAANGEMISPDGGIVVDYKEISEIVGALARLDDPSLRRSMGLSNMDKVTRLYSEKKVVEQYIGVYRAVIKQGDFDRPAKYSDAVAAESENSTINL